MTIRANDPETYLNRGICLVKKGLVSEAAADFQRVLKLTNHSDFAEPAKQYLRECESTARQVASRRRRQRLCRRPVLLGADRSGVHDLR